MNNSAHSRIALSVHYRIYSAPQALRDYLRQMKYGELLYISHPLPTHDTTIEDNSFYELSEGEKLIERKEQKRKTENIFYSTVKDILFTLYWIVKNGEFDVFIGVDNLNAFSGIILKKLRIVKKVVYYTIDYFPTRFNNQLLNKLYHIVEKFCVTYADEVWNVSPVMAYAREKHNGMDKALRKKQYTLPIGVWFEKSPRKKFLKIGKTKLIFSGHLVPHMGVDLAIRSMPSILKRIPDATLEIVGGGQEENKLRQMVTQLKLEKHVIFWGWVRDRKKLEEILSLGAVGIAPFNTEILDEKVKNADPGKIKDYMVMGMPVIVTDAISTADKIKKSKSGIIIQYKSEDFVDAVVTLLKDSQTLREYRENALSYARQFDYYLLFGKHIERVLSH